MGQLIRLPLPLPAYPDGAAELDPAECVLLFAIRRWLADHRCSIDPLPRLCQALDIAGAHDAAFSVDRMMTVIGGTLRRPVVIHCPECSHVSDDEKILLHAASLAQAGDAQRAEKALRTALLSAQGAEFALGSFESLGELFTAAHLRLRRRSPPPPADVAAQIIEPWFAVGSSETTP